ncbi:DUF1565 domain-containing protein [Tumidithrix helvetica]|uniref:DUF1565 domain-containing protein n=1 Tax=Tumidithrix helvetica TaxID=3457545 RepID=UPI003CC5EDEB
MNSFRNSNFRDSDYTISKLTQLVPIAAVFVGLAFAESPASAQKNMQAIAQRAPQALIAEAIPQTVIYVDPINGSDRVGNQSQAVLKTITYALKLSSGSNVIIQLARGTYSATNGEVFPLQVPSNVILRGDEASKGKEIRIVGGGNFNSPLFSSQNVTIVASDRAELRGVTITNPNVRGYGLWIESSSPIVANNTLTGNQQDGAIVTGNSAALISSNVFLKNVATGISISGVASPEIRGNLLQNNGFGLNILQDAAPQVTENMVSGNQDGILAQGNSRPVLRSNAIENSQRSGLMILGNASPDLGSSKDSGGNIFRNNSQSDVQNATSKVIASIGNQVNPKKVTGKLQFLDSQTASVSPTATSLLPSQVYPQVSPVKPTVRLTLKPPKPTQTTSLIPSSLPNPAIRTVATNQVTPSVQSYTRTAHPVYVPASSSSLSNALNSLNNSQLELPQRFEPLANSVVVRIAPNQFSAPIPTNTTISNDLPPIRMSPPAGEPVNRPIVIAPPSSTAFSNPRINPSDRPRYRVVIPVSSREDTLQIRRVIPNAFASNLNGRLVVQVGAYNDRKIANTQVQNLAQSGFSAVVETISP